MSHENNIMNFWIDQRIVITTEMNKLVRKVRVKDGIDRHFRKWFKKNKNEYKYIDCHNSYYFMKLKYES